MKKWLLSFALIVASLTIGYSANAEESVNLMEYIEQVDVPQSVISDQQFEAWDKIAESKVQQIPTLGKSLSPQNCCGMVEDGVYLIKLRDSDFYMDVINAANKNGQGLHTWTKHMGAAQLFYIKNLPYGEIAIFNLMGWKSLEIQNANNFNGAKIQIWDYYGLPCQRWSLEVVYGKDGYPDERGSVKLINVNSEKALDRSVLVNYN